MKKILIPVLVVLVLAGSAWLYIHSQEDFSYMGIPAVSCLDDTKPVLQNFSFTLDIKVSGQEVDLPPNLGHDNGNCLRSIHTDDSSGVVKVRSNYADVYSLGQFFNVWHQAFGKNVLLGHEAGQKHVIDVIVNGHEVTTYENTLLLPGDNIKIIYN